MFVAFQLSDMANTDTIFASASSDLRPPPAKRSARRYGFLTSLIIRSLPISYEITVTEYRNYWRRECEDEAARLAYGTKIHRPVDVPGMLRMKTIIKDFNNALDTWQSYQSDVFFNMLNCNKQMILGNDYVNCVSVVNEQHNWSNEPDECLVIAYRGCGKSTVLAESIAAFLKGIECYDAMVYSGDITKSKDLLNSIWSAFENMTDSDQDFKDGYYRMKNSKQIAVWSKDPKSKDRRCIRGASSFSKTVSQTFSLSLSLSISLPPLSLPPFSLFLMATASLSVCMCVGIE